jgi:hypothetical protein
MSAIIRKEIITSENAEKLWDALDEYWAGDMPGLKSAEGLLIIGATVQYGVPPNQIVLYNSLTNMYFDEAWDAKVDERSLSCDSNMCILLQCPVL